MKAAFALGVIAGLARVHPDGRPDPQRGARRSPWASSTRRRRRSRSSPLYVGIQFLENHLLIPLLMKGGVDLPPALTILAQALMALLFGFLGLMVAVPAARGRDGRGEDAVRGGRGRRRRRPVEDPTRRSDVRVSCRCCGGFRRSRALPRATLGTFPTPVERIALRDGRPCWSSATICTATPIGGNKVRGAGVAARRRRAGDDVVTVGPRGSTHALTTAHVRASARRARHRGALGPGDERRGARASRRASRTRRASSTRTGCRRAYAMAR